MILPEPMPSLMNAYVQRDRGREHLAALRPVHDRVVAEGSRVISFTTEPGQMILVGEAGPLVVVSGRQAPPVPPTCAVIIGESANSFRKALDYLVHQLAALDSGAAQPRTQFPIHDDRRDFERHRPKFLRGVSPKHVDQIEALQPYRGCQWTGPLAMLTNRDKHNDLVLVAHDFLVSSTQPRREDGMITVTATMTPTLALTVVPGATMNVLQTLERIEAGVTQTLDAFAPAFPR
jgi:hypothetical protein